MAALALACLIAPASPLAQNAYITNSGDSTVSVIHTPTNTVIATILVGSEPLGVAATPDGSKVYVTNQADGSVSVISTATDTVTGSPMPVGRTPFGVAATPDGRKVYVANFNANTVSVINTVTATIPVGNNPVAFGVFMQPERTFAGTPGHSNCYAKSVSALVRQYHGLHAAAAALGFSSIRALETTVLAFCEGCRPTTHGHRCD
jgi:YVTN family beta-propeller protein